MTNTISQSAGDNAILFGSIGQVGTINILKLDSTTGGRVTIAPPESQQSPQLRSLPILLLPRPFPLLLGRRDEIKLALNVLPYDQPVEFYGASGIGKTVFLRYLAHHPLIAPAFPDGIIYHRCHQQQSVSDLLQILFNAFYDSSIQFKPTDIQIREALKDKKALIFFDGVRLTRNEVQGIITDLAKLTFVFTSSERHLWGEGQSVALGGLPLADAVALLARELGRTLSTEERLAAEAICTALNGHPLRILQTLAQAREDTENLTLDAIAQQFSPATNVSWVEKLLSPLQKPQRMILALLAALGANIALGADTIADITELAEVHPLLATLLQHHLIQVEDERYSLASSLIDELQQQSDVTPWMEKTLTYFTNWVQNQGGSQSLLANSDAIVQVLAWAVGAGRYSEVLTLGKAIEGKLALSGQWGIWDKLLQWMQEAAHATGNQAIEAYTLHQLGTRALCLNQITEAQDYLQQALQIRESLNDQAGIEATNHNLQFIRHFPSLPPSEPQPKLVDSPPYQDIPPFIKFGTAVLLLILGGLGIRLFWPWFAPGEQKPLEIVNSLPPVTQTRDRPPTSPPVTQTRDRPPTSPPVTQTRDRPPTSPPVTQTRDRPPTSPPVTQTRDRLPTSPPVTQTRDRPPTSPPVTQTRDRLPTSPPVTQTRDRIQQLIDEGALPSTPSNSLQSPTSPKLQSLSISPTEVFRDGDVSVTVTLNSPAPANGIQVTIDSSDRFLVPKKILEIPSGETTRTFNFRVSKELRPGETSYTVVDVNITVAYGTETLPPKRLRVRVFG